jgi:fatty-acyl-CoA synthase
VTASRADDGTCTITAHVAATDTVGSADLNRFCLERIPRYMIPDEIRFVAELPRTATGKVDRYTLEHSTTR